MIPARTTLPCNRLNNPKAWLGLTLICLLHGGRLFAEENPAPNRPFELRRFNDTTTFVLLNSRSIRNEILGGIEGPYLRSLLAVVSGDNQSKFESDDFERIVAIESEFSDTFQFAQHLINELSKDNTDADEE